jgi:hypothetical protein
MQRGTIFKQRNSWTLVYYDTQYRNGKKKQARPVVRRQTWRDIQSSTDNFDKNLLAVSCLRFGLKTRRTHESNQISA